MDTFFFFSSSYNSLEIKRSLKWSNMLVRCIQFQVCCFYTLKGDELRSQSGVVLIENTSDLDTHDVTPSSPLERLVGEAGSLAT